MKIHLNIVKKNDQPIKEAVDSFIQSNKSFAKRYSVNRIKNIWKESMGPTISSYTKYIYLKDKTLFINITSSALRQDLSMSKEKIKTMLNEKIGNSIIEEVVVR